MKQFQRVYIEISNICNQQCSFCPEVERPKKIMEAEVFARILQEVKPFTREICLHLMGEPLSHPQFPEIISICSQIGVPVQLTTNGTLLSHFDYNVLLNPIIRQINFSLHSFKDNFPDRDWKPYLYDIMSFSKTALKEAPNLYLNYRLWNLTITTQLNHQDQDVIDEIMQFFQININERLNVTHRRSKNITGRLYFHFDTRFKWPSLRADVIGESGFCYALSQHVGIHADGTVVACCLDKEAGNSLGNVLEKNFAAILNGPIAQNLLQGFLNNKLNSPLCQRCEYITRFKKTPLSESKFTAPIKI